MFSTPKSTRDRKKAKTGQIHSDSAGLGNIHRKKLLHPIDNARFLGQDSLNDIEDPDDRDEPRFKMDPSLGR
jgi:hypothetical protein